MYGATVSGGLSARESDDIERRRGAMCASMLATPFLQAIGLRIDAFTPAEARLTLPFDEKLTNDGRHYHGGVVAAVLDTAGAAAFWGAYDYGRRMRASTITASVQFTGACDRSDLTCEARVIRQRKDLVFTEARACDSAGRVVAHGQQTYRLAPLASVSATPAERIAGTR